MMRRVWAGLLVGITLSGPAMAADVAPGDGPALRGSYLHVGVAAARQADDGKLTVGGLPFPGAGYVTQLGVAPALEAGMFLRGSFAVSISASGPFSTPNTGAGTLLGVGDLGDETGAFYALTAHYHLPLTDRIRPYVGGGIGYMQVLGTHDGVISNFNVNSAAGAVLQAGVDIAVDENAGVFVDVKHYLLTTEASGTLGPVAVTAVARVDPWIVSSGLALAF